MRQNILIFAGILGVLMGILFMLQGAGVVRFPVQSTMIDDRVWILRGAIVAAISAVLVAGVRLVPTRAEEKARRRAEEEALDLDLDAR